MLPAYIREPLGPRFRVQDASEQIPLGVGWIVTDRWTRNQVWTGGHMTLADAAAKLISQTDHYNGD